MRATPSTLRQASLAAACLLAFAGEAAAQTQPMSKEFPAGQVGLVEVQTELGPVRVVGTDSKTVKVDVLDADPVKCRLTMELRARTLFLKAERPKKWLFDSARCPSGFRVQIPKAAPLDAATGAGSVEIAQTGGKTSVKTGSGNVRLVGVSGDLSARLGNGSIEGETDSKALDVSVGSGRIRLSWTKPPKRGRCDVKTGSGDIALVFPEGSKLSVQALSAAGKTVNDFPDPARRAFLVSAVSGSGDISVRKPGPQP